MTAFSMGVSVVIEDRLSHFFCLQKFEQTNSRTKWQSAFIVFESFFLPHKYKDIEARNKTDPF